jgi:gliding motility-associated-like protein
MIDIPFWKQKGETEPGLKTCFIYIKIGTMIKQLLFIIGIVFACFGKTTAQCPQIYDYLGNPSANAQFIYCLPGPYTMNIASPSNFPAYTINWGDGSANNTGASYTNTTSIQHVYAATVNTFVITLSIPASACVYTMLVAMELPVTSAICIPSLGLTQACAPKTLTFTNCSGSVSAPTTFTWDFGDGSPPQVFNATNAGQNVTHTYQKNTVNCQTAITLSSRNYCRSSPSIISYNPIQIYDVDIADISTPVLTRCWPDNSFTFSNSTSRNCLVEGNTAQRFEYWNLGNHFGQGVDSIVDWRPWPPSAARTVSYSGVGSYTVFLADSNQCGIATRILTVNIINPPVAGVIAPPGLLCQGTVINFTNSSAPGYSYKWNFGTNPAFVNLSGGNKSNIYPTPGTYTVKVVAFINGSNNFCSDTASTVITILAAPVSNFSFSPATGCGSLTGVTFTNTSTGATTYTWTFGNGNTSNLFSPVAQNYNLPGTYPLSLAITATTGCVNTKTDFITVYSKPVPNFPTFSTCVNSVSNFTNTSTVTGTTAINSYTWNFGNGAPITNIQNPSYTYTVANTYTVKLIAATPFCSDSVSKTISINLRPVANFVFTPTISCPPFAVSFSNTTSNGVNYLWRFNALSTNTSNLSSPSFTYGNSTQITQNNTITLIALTGAGCADSIRKSISIYPKPVVSFTTNLILGCSPIVINFTNTSIGVNTYTWNYGDGSSVSTQTNTSYTYTNTGLVSQLRTVELYAINAFGCRDTTRKIIQVFPQPLSNFTIAPGSGCGPLTVNFSPALGAISYTWNYGDGSPISNATNPPHTFTNTGTADLTFTITLSTTNAFGCIGSSSGITQVFGKPVANFIFTPNAGCTPLVVTYSNTSLLNNTNNWQFGNGLSSTNIDPSVTFTNASGQALKVFTTKLVVTSTKGCKDSVSKQLTILGQPKSAFDLDTPACAPKVIKFQNNSISANSYTWNFGDGTQSIQKDPQKLFTNTSSVNQTYLVTLTVTSNDGCKDFIAVPLVMHPKPVYFIVSKPDSGCSALTVNFSKINGAVKYTWDYYQDGSSPIVSTNSVSNTYQNKGSFDKTFQTQMIAEDIFGCSDTAYKTIKVFPNPTALFRADPLKVYIPNDATQMIDLSALASTYQWNFGDGNTSQEKMPSHVYTKPGEYVISLTVTSTRGCKDSYKLLEKIMVIDETAVLVPNAFTPNTGGSKGGFYSVNPLDPSINEIFHPKLRGAEKYQLSIFSRWGELLFDTKDPAEGWDGYYKGKLCTQDVYIWKVEATFVDGKVFNKTGDLLLLR